MSDVVIRKPTRPPVVVNPVNSQVGGIKVVVKKGEKGDKGDDKVYVGLTPPNPRGNYEVWVKATPP